MVNSGSSSHPRFITFEGCDNTGKTTQITLMAQCLRRRGFRVLVTREPGGTLVGDQIRRLLLDSAGGLLSPTAEALMFCADRANHVEQVIRPALEEGQFVLCDRHADSTIAYQGYGLGVDIHWLSVIHQYILQGLKPGLTMLFVNGSLKMEGSCNPDLVESRSQQFKERVRSGFLNIARTEKDRVFIIRVDADPQTIHLRVRKLVMRSMLATIRRKEV